MTTLYYVKGLHREVKPVTEPSSIPHATGANTVEVGLCGNGKWLEVEWIIQDISQRLYMKVCFMAGNHREDKQILLI